MTIILENTYEEDLFLKSSQVVTTPCCECSSEDLIYDLKNTLFKDTSKRESCKNYADIGLLFFFGRGWGVGGKPRHARHIMVEVFQN